MSHKGHFGPVLYRRDMNLNVTTNDDGFARRYLVSFTLLPTGIAHVLQGTTFDLGPETYPQLNEISWKSAYRKLGVAQYQVELLVDIDANGFSYTKLGSVNVLNQGIIWVWQYAHAEVGQPSFPRSETQRTVFFSTDWFDQEPNALSTNVFYKLWSDGPPH